MAQGVAARRAALAVLGQVLGVRRLLADVLADAAGPLAGLAAEDRARAQRLALATLRRLEPADTVLAPLLRKPPPAMLRNLLRLAVVELAERPADAHGIVNAAVAIARGNRATAAQAGFVNAVLRRVAEMEAPLAALPPQRLPPWLRTPLRSTWGRAAVAGIEAAHAAGAPLDLTPRDPAQAAEWAERLGADLLPTGSLRLAAAGQVSALAGYDGGDWWVQDAAAAIPARLLAPAPGERVLDLCAAPGGKTMQLAAAGARVTALDISAARMARVAENLARTGLAADCVAADALVWEPAQPFDAVLLDAPCSATGTIRRHPDLPFVKDAAGIADLAALQARLIDRALAWLRPGGRLVFCTCSILPEEGEGQLAAALARHPLEVEVEDAMPPGADPAWRAKGGGLRLRPDMWANRGGMDGFFMVRLRRRA